MYILAISRLYTKKRGGGGSIHFTIKQLNSVHLFFLKNSFDLKIKTPSDLPNFTSHTPLPIHKRKKKTKIQVYMYPFPLMGPRFSLNSPCLNCEPIQSQTTCTCFESYTHNYLPYPKNIFTPPAWQSYLPRQGHPWLHRAPCLGDRLHPSPQLHVTHSISL